MFYEVHVYDTSPVFTSIALVAGVVDVNLERTYCTMQFVCSMRFRSITPARCLSTHHSLEAGAIDVNLIVTYSTLW